MKFGKYLESKARPEWAAHYVNYKALKDLIKEAVNEVQRAGGNTTFSPRMTSLTVQRAENKNDSASECFFAALENEVQKVAAFTDMTVSGLRTSLRELKTHVDTIHSSSGEPISKSPEAEKLLEEAKRIGDDFLQLEKYVNLNYMGFHKILKKHDKMLPHQPCKQFYTSHLHNQPWVQGTYSDLLVSLSAIYSKIRGDTVGVKNEDSAQGFVRSTTKYWVKTSEVSSVKHHILQHLPVFQYTSDNFAGDAQLINSVYLDNSSLELYHGRLDKRPNAVALRMRWYGNSEPKVVFVERKTHKESWKGEESVKERFVLPEEKVVPFLEGEYTVDVAVEELRAKGKSEAEIEKFASLFSEVQQAVDAKQLRPMTRTQYMRAAFQYPFDATVRVSLDTNLTMIKENPDDGPSCTLAGRWYRDPDLPISRSEMTRFPHAILEIKLSLPEGELPPDWVAELLESGYLTEVHKFSKFIHGTCTLMPDMVQAVPYWVDDESVRPSILASAPPVPQLSPMEPGLGSKPRRRMAPGQAGADPLMHPLLGDAPTLNLMTGAPISTGVRVPGPGFFDRMFKLSDKRQARTTPMRIEPKTFFANERTFLSWLRMAVTVGSIAAALLGFAASSDRVEEHGAEYDLVAIICLILLPVSVVIALYALGTFMWRSRNIAVKQVGFIDDKVGPMYLCSFVILALSGIFVISVIDLADAIRDHEPNPPAGPPAPPAPGGNLLSME